MEEAKFNRAILKETRLQGARLLKADFQETNLQQTDLKEIDWQGANLQGMDLPGTNFQQAILRGAILKRAKLQGANLSGAKLQGAHLEDTDLQSAHVEGCNLSEAFFSRGTKLRRINLADKKENRIRRFVSFLSGKRHDAKQFISLAGVHWGEADLSVVNWRQLYMIHEEYEAHQWPKMQQRTRLEAYKGTVRRKVPINTLSHGGDSLEAYKGAVRANRQLAVALQEQGLNEDATKFAYRAQVLQMKVFWNGLLGPPTKFTTLSPIAYLFIISLCAGAYFVLGMYAPHPISLPEAVLTSVTAFHGRVFSDTFLQSGELQRWVTVFEAVAGLVIEGIFIAMLAQRFFGK